MSWKCGRLSPPPPPAAVSGDPATWRAGRKVGTESGTRPGGLTEKLLMSSLSRCSSASSRLWRCCSAVSVSVLVSITRSACGTQGQQRRSAGASHIHSRGVVQLQSLLTAGNMNTDSRSAGSGMVCGTAGDGHRRDSRSQETLRLSHGLGPFHRVSILLNIFHQSIPVIF